MAPHKKPESLFNLACKTHTLLLYNSCLGIQRRHKTYDNKECVQAVEDLQTVLLSNVPCTMWNDMCERLILLVHEQDTMLTPTDQVLMISYALFAHEELTHVILVSSSEQYWGYYLSQRQREKLIQFWEKIFARINKVTEIAFPFDICDCDLPRFAWMFRVISKHCRHLEKMNIGQTVYQVDEAVSYLLNCTKLRRIEGADLRCEFSREKYKDVLESLTELECFEDPQLVSCFPDFDDGRSLKLTHLIVDQQRSTPLFIKLAVQICPNLKHLNINPMSEQDCSSILEILADINSNLTSLTVQSARIPSSSYFPSSDSCQRFFSIKGILLLNLKFEYCYGSIAFESVKIIGEYCLNLKRLHIDLKSLSSDQVIPPSASDMSIDHRSPVFKKLTKLTLEDFSNDTDHGIFKWCVMHAANLETLSLDNDFHFQLNLEDFRDMFANGRFPNLVSVTFGQHWLSKEIIQCVYDNCQKMRKLSIKRPLDFVASEYIITLKECIARNNIDLTISD